jgi:hypothetical protein
MFVWSSAWNVLLWRAITVGGREERRVKWKSKQLSDNEVEKQLVSRDLLRIS